MIDYAYLEAGVRTRLGETFVNDPANPSAMVDAINDAIEHISETIFRDNFILEYTFTATGDRTTYSIPIQHSTKQIFSGDDELIEGEQWVMSKDRLNNRSKISVGVDTITFPSSTETRPFTILNR